MGSEVLLTRLLLVLEVWDGKPTYRKSWAGNLLVWSDLTSDLTFDPPGNLLMWSDLLDPSFKVKRG